MQSFFYFITCVVETLFRLFPFPVKTGLIKIGNPDKNAPVFLTCNFDLTVKQVRRALRGMDAYLLVANSHGINVWCAATGGHLGNHEVISVIKTSGIEKLVGHRNIILPQLAATGVHGKEIHKKTGWKVLWGPVYAHDIANFVKANFTKNESMKKVQFPFWNRMEMGIMWAFPMGLITLAVMAIWWKNLILQTTALFVILTIFIYGFFPLFKKLLVPDSDKKKTSFSMIWDMIKTPVLLWLVFLVFLFAGVNLAHDRGLLEISVNNFIMDQFILSGIIILILSIDLSGTTPLLKSGMMKDRYYHVDLDLEKCRGAGNCEDVCPKNCFEVDFKKHTASMPRSHECVQCGACIVQCPFDALSFVTPEGGEIEPENIRIYKLNMMGKRIKEKN